MSADLLRRAAAELRKSVEHVPGGFWWMLDGWGPAGDGLMRARRIANDKHETVLDAGSGGADLRGEAAAFELIAMMACPPVALAVAHWLDELVRRADEMESERHGTWPDGINHGVAIARAVLREEP